MRKLGESASVCVGKSVCLSHDIFETSQKSQCLDCPAKYSNLLLTLGRDVHLQPLFQFCICEYKLLNKEATDGDVCSCAECDLMRESE